LRPERARYVHVRSLNFTPSQLTHFTGSIDYYHIRVKDEGQCNPVERDHEHLCQQRAIRPFCSQNCAHRPAAGGLVGKRTPRRADSSCKKNFQTSARRLVSGIDLQLAYKLDLPAGFGGLQFEMNGAYLQHQETTPACRDSITYDLRRALRLYLPDGQPALAPISFRTTWQMPWERCRRPCRGRVSLQGLAGQQHRGSVRLHFLVVGCVTTTSMPRSPSFSYLDLEATWKRQQGPASCAPAPNKTSWTRIRRSSTALLSPTERERQNTYSVYDMLGRQLFVAVQGKVLMLLAAARQNANRPTIPEPRRPPGIVADSRVRSEPRHRLARRRASSTGPPGTAANCRHQFAVRTDDRRDCRSFRRTKSGKSAGFQRGRACVAILQMLVAVVPWKSPLPGVVVVTFE